MAAASRLPSAFPEGERGRDRFPARPAGRAKEGQEGGPDHRSLGSDAPRARRLGPWPRASALRTVRTDALSACAQPRHRCRDGRGRRPSRVTRLFASGPTGGEPWTPLSGLTPHPTPTSRTPPEAPLWVGCTVYSPIGIKCQARRQDFFLGLARRPTRGAAEWGGGSGKGRCGSRSFLRPEQRTEIAGAVRDSNHFNPARNQAVQNEPALVDEAASIGMHIVPHRSKLGKPFQLPAALKHRIDEAVGDPGTPFGQKVLDREQIFARLVRE